MLRAAVERFGAHVAVGAGAAGAAAAAAVPTARCAKDEAKTVAPSFDPEALERGAKALREINLSPHAKNVSVPPPCRPALTPISLPIPRSAKNNPDGWIDLDPIVTY